ncbi:DUF3592 domain-containing protein [Hyphomicrobium sp.]|uniref:DUF3592 domain-containing protein n=1 Tax=Hyphomicrobium sp. TaxID=82 RepID=UPI003F7251FA
MSWASRIFISQHSFDAWANAAKSRTLFAISALMLMVALACSAAITIMGPRLVREAALLWFGTKTDGVLQSVKLVEVGKFKGGDPKYELTIHYRFAASDGVERPGTTVRSDVRTPPSFQPGDRVGVYYQARNPANSVAEHNLRTDVYALLLFLPFLTVVGIAAPLWFLLACWTWRRKRRTAR